MDELLNPNSNVPCHDRHNQSLYFSGLSWGLFSNIYLRCIDFPSQAVIFWPIWVCIFRGIIGKVEKHIRVNIVEEKDIRLLASQLDIRAFHCLYFMYLFKRTA